MHLGRRSEGVKSLRGIFGRARRDCWIPWEAGKCFFPFCSLFDLGNNPSFLIALMEYCCSDRLVAVW
jgi:hypothetical protein